jgi:uncharacterized protein with HEPN domain
MQHDPRKYLWDAREAADAILVFTRGKSWEDFQQEVMLRSAVERQFEIIGEALSQLSRRDPALARQIPDLPQIVAFRNILVHGYAIVNHETVWRAVQDHLPALREALRRLLGEP